MPTRSDRNELSSGHPTRNCRATSRSEAGRLLLDLRESFGPVDGQADAANALRKQADRASHELHHGPARRRPGPDDAILSEEGKDDDVAAVGRSRVDRRPARRHLRVRPGPLRLRRARRAVGAGRSRAVGRDGRPARPGPHPLACSTRSPRPRALPTDRPIRIVASRSRPPATLAATPSRASAAASPTPASRDHGVEIVDVGSVGAKVNEILAGPRRGLRARHRLLRVGRRGAVRRGRALRPRALAPRRRRRCCSTTCRPTSPTSWSAVPPLAGPPAGGAAGGGRLVNLTGLLDCLGDDPGFVAVARRWPGRGRAPTVEAPSALHPLLVAATRPSRGGRRHRSSWSRPPAARPRTSPPRCRACCRGATVAVFPSWETLPHERLSPSLGHGRPTRRGHAPARAPRPRPTRSTQPIDVLVTLRARVPPAGRHGHRRRRAGAAARRRRGPAARARRSRSSTLGYERNDLVERRGQVAVRGGILDVFPPDRGAPAARGVLGRHGRGDPHVRGGRPAVAGAAPTRPVGAGRPRAAAHRRRCGRGRAELAATQPRTSPTCATSWREGIAVEGMESLAPVLADGMTTPLELVPRPAHVVLLRARADPQARPRRGAHGAGVPRWPRGTTRRSAMPRPSTWRPPATASSTRCATSPGDRGDAWWQVTPLATDAELDDRPRDVGGPRIRDRGQRAASPTAASPRRALADMRDLDGRRVGGSCCSPRATARSSAWSRSSPTPASPVVAGGRPVERAPKPGRRAPSRAAGCCTASPSTRAGSPCSPRPTSSGSGPPPRTCAGCRRVAAGPSTR